MAVNRLVVVGASSGGIDALRTVLRELPSDFPVPICIVVHTSSAAPGMLDLVFRQVTRLAVKNAAPGDRLRPGHVYVAPPDHHLIAEPGTLRLSKGPKENRFRPAIDPLFRSAAQVYGPGAIGVILSGNLDDGTAGLLAIKRLGGTAIVQDPSDAMFPSMPQSAVDHVPVDHVVPLARVAPLLTAMVGVPVDEAARVSAPKDMEVEVKIAREENALEAGLGEIAELSPIACPECHGVLLRLKEADPIRFRCHTGHAYSADSLVAAINEGIEASLWGAVRALQEGSILLEHLATHASVRVDDARQEALQRQLDVARAQVDAIRKLATERAGLMISTQVSSQR